ncbi:MAG: dethiobiotin synthase [Alphaproteobacteria bacterium]|nr:dethiobiotin synthase [Alphaproteobacteria bacterium]
MRQKFVITGTDTDIGKTVFSAGLMLALEGAGATPHYWKPVQSGVSDSIDTHTVRTLTNLGQDRFLPESYVFSESLSPHRAAELDDVHIDIDALKTALPDINGTLIIEGAGGLMVPLTRENLLINLFKKWRIPVILCARTGLGTINHTLLSLEALWSRNIPVHGIAFIGERNVDNVKTIGQFSETKILGTLPIIEDLSPENLKGAFEVHFDIEDFLPKDIAIAS